MNVRTEARLEENRLLDDTNVKKTRYLLTSEAALKT